MLSNEWTVKDSYPIDYIPGGVRLTAYGGDADDLPPHVLQDFLDAVVSIHRVYNFDQIVDAHAAMEAVKASGKLVVVTNPLEHISSAT
jgi:NADPH2:quinone reductase